MSNWIRFKRLLQLTRFCKPWDKSNKNAWWDNCRRDSPHDSYSLVL